MGILMAFPVPELASGEIDEPMIDVTALPMSPSDVLFGAAEPLMPGEGSPVPRPAVSHPRRINATEEGWERHREEIKDLYQDQGKKLREVMQIMERTHAFVAK